MKLSRSLRASEIASLFACHNTQKKSGSFANQNQIDYGAEADMLPGIFAQEMYGNNAPWWMYSQDAENPHPGITRGDTEFDKDPRAPGKDKDDVGGGGPGGVGGSDADRPGTSGGPFGPGGYRYNARTPNLSVTGASGAPQAGGMSPQPQAGGYNPGPSQDVPGGIDTSNLGIAGLAPAREFSARRAGLTDADINAARNATSAPRFGSYQQTTGGEHENADYYDLAERAGLDPNDPETRIAYERWKAENEAYQQGQQLRDPNRNNSLEMQEARGIDTAALEDAMRRGDWATVQRLAASQPALAQPHGDSGAYGLSSYQGGAAPGGGGEDGGIDVGGLGGGPTRGDTRTLGPRPTGGAGQTVLPAGVTVPPQGSTPQPAPRGAGDRGAGNRGTRQVDRGPGAPGGGGGGGGTGGGGGGTGGGGGGGGTGGGGGGGETETGGGRGNGFEFGNNDYLANPRPSRLSENPRGRVYPVGNRGPLPTGPDGRAPGGPGPRPEAPQGTGERDPRVPGPTDRDPRRLWGSGGAAGNRDIAGRETFGAYYDLLHNPDVDEKTRNDMLVSGAKEIGSKYGGIYDRIERGGQATGATAGIPAAQAFMARGAAGETADANRATRLALEGERQRRLETGASGLERMTAQETDYLMNLLGGRASLAGKPRETRTAGIYDEDSGGVDFGSIFGALLGG